MTTGPSSNFRIETNSRVDRQLARLSKKDYRAVRKTIDDLAQEPRPRGVLKLRGGKHRVRQGNWRVFYLIDLAERVITITDVLRRNEATYRDL